MKTRLPMAGGRWPVENRNGCQHACPIADRESEIINGFTLIELLVVIAIIGAVAGLTIPALDAVKRRQVISHTQAEMAQFQAAIENYRAAYGFYPPGNPGSVLINQLYYELEGVTTFDAAGDFQVLNDPSDKLMVAPVNQVNSAFGVAGFVNCSKPGSGEDSPAGRNFLGVLRPNQMASYTANGVKITILVGSVGGPDTGYQPVGQTDVNPWRYRYPGVNNPNGYDLWMQLSLFGTTNLICNWSKTVQINSPDQ